LPPGKNLKKFMVSDWTGRTAFEDFSPLLGER
jgi:hypothetical protein